jgi:class 3 adenylate cyclase/TolB-like protein
MNAVTSASVMRTDLAAVVIADIAGYSRMMANDEVRTYHRAREFLDSARRLARDLEGQVDSEMGDGVLATFSSAQQAVSFAALLKTDVDCSTAWRQGNEEPIQLRVGVALGEVMRDERSISGHTVNLAARLQTAAAPGDIYVTRSVRDALASRNEFRFSFIDSLPLKNIPELVDVFQVNVERLVAQRPAASSAVATAPPRGAEAGTNEVVDSGERRSRMDDGRIVILVPENASGNTADAHICASVADDIISDLGRFKQFEVVALHSARVADGRSHRPEDIAAMCRARYVLNGRLWRIENALKVSLTLTDARDGRDIWRDQVRLNIADLFDFRRDTSCRIASTIARTMENEAFRALRDMRTPKLDSYSLVLRGHHLNFTYKRDATIMARRLFAWAAECDEWHGRAYASLSRSLNLCWRYGWAEPGFDPLSEAVRLARKATVLEPEDARGYGALGFATLYLRDYEEALAAYGRAIQINPNDADLLAEAADAFVYVGEAKQAEPLFQRAMELNPLYPDWYLWNLGDLYFHTKQYEKAIATLHRMSDKSEAHRMLAASHVFLGRMDEARHHAQAVLKAHPNFRLEHWERVVPSKNRGEVREIVSALKAAGLS